MKVWRERTWFCKHRIVLGAFPAPVGTSGGTGANPGLLQPALGSRNLHRAFPRSVRKGNISSFWPFPTMWNHSIRFSEGSGVRRGKVELGKAAGTRLQALRGTGEPEAAAGAARDGERDGW